MAEGNGTNEKNWPYWMNFCAKFGIPAAFLGYVLFGFVFPEWRDQNKANREQGSKQTEILQQQIPLLVEIKDANKQSVDANRQGVEALKEVSRGNQEIVASQREIKELIQAQTKK